MYGNPILLFVGMVASLGGKAVKGAQDAKSKFLQREAEKEAFHQGLIQAAFERRTGSSEVAISEVFEAEKDETQKQIADWNFQTYSVLGVGGAVLLVLAIVFLAGSPGKKGRKR